MKSVKEVRELTGVSRRTLQYYDEIGLLPPTYVKESGYRQYDDKSLRSLWIILFYKEVGIPLKDIRALLDNSEEEEKEILARHKQTLLDERARLENMIQSVDYILYDKFSVTMLSDFDKNKIRKIKQKYREEIQTLMKSNFFLPLAENKKITNLYSIAEKIALYKNMDLDDFITLSKRVEQAFVQAMPHGPESYEAQKAVSLFKKLLDKLDLNEELNWREIGQLYLENKDRVDKNTYGLAEFVNNAIKHAST